MILTPSTFAVYPAHLSRRQAQDSCLRAVRFDSATVKLGARSIIIGLEDHETDDSNDHLPMSAAFRLGSVFKTPDLEPLGEPNSNIACP